MIYLYICLSYEDKFTNFYKDYKKEKKDIYNIINKIQIIEQIFIEKKIGNKIKETNNPDEVNVLLKWCNYFSNFINLLFFFIQNPNKNLFNNSSKDYEVSNEDDLPLILQRYNVIKSKIPSLLINKNIWDKYRGIYKAKRNLQNILLLKDVINNKTNLIETINELVIDILTENKLSNIEICKFIQKYLLPNIDWLKGNLNLSLGNYFKLKDLTDEVITEYKNCKFNELYGEENYLIQIQIIIVGIDDFKIFEKSLKLFNFEYNRNNKEERRRFENLINIIIENIGNKLKIYKKDDFDSLINIITFLINKKIKTDQINEIINLLEMNLAFSFLIDILCKILNDEIIKDKNINNDIVKYLLENCIKKNQIDVLITKITNKKKPN